MAADPNINIETHYRTTFSSNQNMLLSNEGSILRGTFVEGDITGEGASVVDQFGTTRGQRNETRAGDNPSMDVERQRRWVHGESWDWGVYVDNKDTLKQVLDPTSQLSQSCKNGLGENLDYDVMLPAFFGIAKIGKKGSEDEEFDAANCVVANTLQPDGSTGSAVGAHVKKFQRGIKILKQFKNKLERETVHVAITAEQWDQLFDDVKVIHGDYISGEALRTGKIPSLFGINFHMLEDLPIAGTTRQCPMWVQSGMHLGIQREMFFDIWNDTSKKNIPYVYGAFIAGATRLENGKVIRIDCEE